VIERQEKTFSSFDNACRIGHNGSVLRGEALLITIMHQQKKGCQLFMAALFSNL
jgi:hypothetical protein